jgi:hypothetical protein
MRARRRCRSRHNVLGRTGVMRRPARSESSATTTAGTQECGGRLVFCGLRAEAIGRGDARSQPVRRPHSRTVTLRSERSRPLPGQGSATRRTRAEERRLLTANTQKSGEGAQGVRTSSSAAIGRPRPIVFGVRRSNDVAHFCLRPAERVLSQKKGHRQECLCHMRLCDLTPWSPSLRALRQRRRRTAAPSR